MVVVFWWPFRVFSKGGELGFPIFKNPNIERPLDTIELELGYYM